MPCAGGPGAEVRRGPGDETTCTSPLPARAASGRPPVERRLGAGPRLALHSANRRAASARCRAFAAAQPRFRELRQHGADPSRELVPPSSEPRPASAKARLPHAHAP